MNANIRSRPDMASRCFGRNSISGSRRKARVWQMTAYGSTPPGRESDATPVDRPAPGVLTSTKRIVGRVNASAIAAASIVSFLFDLT